MIKTSKIAFLTFFDDFVQNRPFLNILFKIGRFWTFCSKSADFEHFWTKCSKSATFEQTVQNPPLLRFFIQKWHILKILKTFKIGHFWTFYSKMQIFKVLIKVQKCQFLNKIFKNVKNAIFDVFIKKCNFWCFYQKIAFFDKNPLFLIVNPKLLIEIIKNLAKCQVFYDFLMKYTGY